MTLKAIQDLTEYRRSKETREERMERLRETQVRLDEMDRRYVQLERDLLPTEELLNRRCTL